MQKPIIMFDMDGTLLDLAFDDLIWNTRLPERHAEKHQCTLEESKEILRSFYQQHNHTLCWYSSKYWTEKVEVDVLQLQYDNQEKIAPRPGCFELLEQLKQQGYRCWLLTNADQAGLQLKLENVDLSPYFEVIISSEEIGYSKEFVEFWKILQQKHDFDPQYAMMIDDTEKVLQGAEKFGITQLITIIQPSSGRAARQAQDLNYPAIQNLTELLPLIETSVTIQKEFNVKTA